MVLVGVFSASLGVLVGTDWLEVVGSLGPLAILLAAVITGLIGWRTLRHSRRALEQKVETDRLNLEQRALADQKNQWWERVQWALDSAFSDTPERQAAGIAMIRVLSQAEWLTEEEIMLLDAAWQEELDEDDEEMFAYEPPLFSREVEANGHAVDGYQHIGDNGEQDEPEETDRGRGSTR
ncbi:hypothetical protein BJ994_000524 [Arthrobacter pigmenti]|uniref:Uncharacterized protein n=1 Tax=Arthrobacter pigmenti TaxID=271432 RepID=A0A846RE92_9MICC|nr:hypothetical protein [Arthrobacter pigmenti]NJC21448.1 hypothetical protein [Arthrobacter pigmenti]